MSMPWFRMYAEFSGDPVVQSLAFEDQRHYVILLCLKCGGTLDRDLPNSHRDRIIARGLGIDMTAASEAKRRLQEVGLVDKNWQPIAWEKRQYSSDVSTDRVRKYRKNKETGNVSETLQNRFGNGPEREQNRTESETDSERESEPVSNVAGLDLQAWEQWVQYRKEIRKPLKQASIPAAQEALAAFGSDQQAVVKQSIANGWQGLFDLKRSPQGAANGKPSKLQIAAEAIRKSNPERYGTPAVVQDAGPEPRLCAISSGPPGGDPGDD